MGVDASRPSLVHAAKSYLKDKYAKPGNVYLGVVSRLDASTSGAILFARTSKAAARLTESFRLRKVEKEYLALVEGEIESSGNWVDWLRKDEQRKRMGVVERGDPGAKEARLSFQRMKVLAGCSLLRIRLETGRKHQIRVQAAARGFPILGDRKYGSRVPFARGIGLHSRYISLIHPVKRTEIALTARTPKSWRSYLREDELD